MRIDFPTLVLNCKKYNFVSIFRNFCKGPAGHAKVPAEVPEDSRVLRARRLCTQLPIALTPGSSSPERPGLGNTTGQPWSDATCPCTTCHLNQILVSVKTNLEGFDFLTQFQLRLLICGTRIVVSGKQTPSARKLIFPCEFAKSSLYQNIEETEI